MEKYTDKIIETIYKHIPQYDAAWELLGFINKKEEVYTFGNDSKIIGRLFEVIITDALVASADELGYELQESSEQTVYPDFYFVKPDKKRIAIDIKTTYRKFSTSGNVSKFGFTGGSFTSFMRNGTKNISGKYSEYDSHYIIGILYTRETHPSTGKFKFNELKTIVPAYKNPEIFIQEKHRICGDKKGSGNTDNIGTIKSNTLAPFIHGAGPFSFLGKEAFHSYWTNHPKYKDSQEIKDSLYNDLPSYLVWLEKTDKDLAQSYTELYKQYLEFNKKNNWL